MKTVLYIVGVASFALCLSACDSSQEEAREKSLETHADLLEDRADVVRERGEDGADAIEASDPGFNSERTEQAAESMREQSEMRADQLEDQADMVREQK